MLKYAADRRTLVFISSYFLLVLAFWNAPELSVAETLAAVALVSIVSWIAAVITHNTIHAPIFKKRWMNRIFQVALTLTYGFPVSEYIPGHNLSHHRFTQKPEDVMRTTKVQYRWNLLNFLAFVPRVAPDVAVANWKFVSLMRPKNPAWFRQYMIETCASWGVKIALFALDWRKCLLFIVVPHFFALWGITAVNFLQHDGCDEDHEFNHSRNFVGRFFNWWTFNNGFHGMHHRQPGLHWSLLPEAHAREIAPHIHPALDQRSLARYLFSAFILPGERVTFEGKPISASPDLAQQPDGNWLVGRELGEVLNSA